MFFARRILEKYPQVDFIVRGEGEMAMCELVGSISGGVVPNNIAGLLWRANDRVRVGPNPSVCRTLDILPWPAYDLIPSPADYAEANGDRRIALNVELARGCCYSCKFCGCSAFWGQRLRWFSIERVLNQIQILHFEYGVNHFYITDN